MAMLRDGGKSGDVGPEAEDSLRQPYSDCGCSNDKFMFQKCSIDIPNSLFFALPINSPNKNRFDYVV